MEHKEEVQEVHRKGGGGEYNHHVDCRGEDGKRGGYEGMCHCACMAGEEWGTGDNMKAKGGWEEGRL